MDALLATTAGALVYAWPTTARGRGRTHTLWRWIQSGSKYGGYILPQRNSKKMNDKLVGPRPLHKQFTVEQASAFDIAQLDAENWPIRESSWEAVGKMSEKVMKQDQLRYMIAGRMKIVRRGFMGIHLFGWACPSPWALVTSPTGSVLSGALCVWLITPPGIAAVSLLVGGVGGASVGRRMRARAAQELSAKGISRRTDKVEVAAEGDWVTLPKGLYDMTVLEPVAYHYFAYKVFREDD